MRKRPSPLSASRSLHRTPPRPMALEQRFMFDGAAAADATDVLTRDVAVDTGLLRVATPAQPLPAALDTAQRQAEQQLAAFLQRPDALQQLFTLFNGGQSQPSQAWLTAAQKLLDEVGRGDYGVDVQLRSHAELNGAFAAFVAAGPQGRPLIVLNGDWLRASADGATVSRVLVEEIGHSIDAQLNGSVDTAGDEGEAFSMAVAGREPDAPTQQRIATENDHGVVTLDGVSYAAEDASVTFTQAYRGTPASASEEASALNGITPLTPFAGTGFSFVSSNPSDTYYSGNNVTGTLSYKDSGGVDRAIYGVVSRLFKTNGVVNGFYFYAPGADGIVGTQDSGEAAYLLVVNPAKFTAGGNYGTSSDPVDTALNNLLLNYTPAAAQADAGVAVEQGAAVAGSNATGNVLTNDVGNASPTVTAVGTTAASSSVTTPLASGGRSITGSYGVLTLGTDGNYSYAVNNSLAAVQALRTSTDTLKDSFTYQITDSHSPAAMSTATLTITIQGANDAPTAVADTGTAKISLRTDGTAYTAPDTIGTKGTGNVLYNDSDVDQYGETARVTGLTASGSYVSYTAGGTATSLSFTGSNGSFYKSVAIGDYLYTAKIGSAYYLLKTASGANITVTSKAINADGSYSIGLSGTIDHYNTSTAYPITNGSTKVDFYPDGTKDGQNLPSAKEATVNLATSVQYSTVTLSSITGNVVVGMTASGTNIPSGAKVTAINGNVVTLDRQIATAPSGTISFVAAGGVTVNGALGTLVLNADGSYVYTPQADSTGGTGGTEVFTYTMQDADGRTSAATLSIVVQASTASDPNAQDDAVTGTEQGSSAGTDPAGNVITGAITAGTGTGGVDAAGTGASFGASPVTGGRTASALSMSAMNASGYVDLVGRYGTLRLYGTGAYVYSIANGNPLVDSLSAGESLRETFYYTATNSLGRTDTAALTVAINGANDAPVAVNDGFRTSEDNALTLTAAELLGNDQDVDDPVLTLVSVTSGSGGTVIKNADGSVTFTPTANFNGTASFTYTVSDGTATATATVNVIVDAVNDYPVARNNTYTTPLNTLLAGRNVITNNDASAGTDSDVESTTAALTIARVNGSVFSANGTDAAHLAAAGWMQVALAHGTLFIKSDGTTEYRPASGDNAGDSFTYTVTDGSGESDPATVRVNVTANITPTLSVGNVTVSEASPYAVFEVSLDMPGTGPISFTPTLVSGTATAGTDTGASSALQYYNGSSWVSAAGGVTLATGATSVLLRTAVTNDSVFEGSESFTLSTGALTGSVINTAGASGTGTIKDDGSSTNVFLAGNTTAQPTAGSADNDTPVLSVSDVTVSEASPYAVFQVSLSNASTQAIGFTPTLGSGTATVGTDTDASAALQVFDGSNWVSAASGITFAAGTTTRLLRTSISNDAVFEGAESFTLNTGAISGGVRNAAGASGTGTIKDDGSSTQVFLAGNNSATPTTATADDDTPSVSIAVSPAGLREDAAGMLTYTVTLSNASAEDTAVSYTLSGSAMAGDYVTTGTGSLTIAAGATTASFTVDPTTDTVVEGDETVVATLTAASTQGVTLALPGATATGTLINDDVAIAVSSDRSAVKAGETALISFTLSEASSDFTLSDVLVSGGTLGNFSGSGSSYTAVFTPTPGSTTPASVRVDSNAFTGNAGVANADGAEADNSVSIAVDTVRPTLAVSADRTALKLGETATLTFTLSESSSDFTAADVSVTGGTLSGFSGSGTSYTATFTPSATTGSVAVASSRFADAAGNANNDGADADNAVAFTYDGVRPTIAITADKTALKLGDTATLTFTLSESSSDFTAADIAVTGGTLSGFSGSGTSYTATFTPTAASGAVSVASGTFADAAGNTNNDGADADNAVAFTYDGVRPTIAITAGKTGLKLGDTATLTFTLSESSSDFTAADITVTGGTLSGFGGSGTTYAATFTPTATFGAVAVASGTFADVAGNANNDGADADNAVAFTYDGVRPTIAITADKTGLKLGETATLTFTLSESSSDFTAADITVTGGTLSGFSGSGTTYTATFTPTAASGAVSVDSGTFADAAGNQNADGAEANNAVAFSHDGVRPTVAVTADQTRLKLGETATLTFTLSEPSTDFTAADLTVSGGTLGGFSGSGTRYTAVFTPSAASGAVSVASGKFTDAAGNANADGADADNAVAFVHDGVRPTIAVTADKTSLKLGDTATLTFTLSEPSADFTAADVAVTGGTLSDFTGTGRVYTARFTPAPAARGTAAVSVASGRFTDAAGNANADGADADNAVALAFDTFPAPAVSSPVVNEASPYAVFTVSGGAGQPVELTLAGVSAQAGGVDFGDTGAARLQVSLDGGRSWANYAGALTLPASGTLLARTPVVDDAISDNNETFTLTATSATGAAAGTATLKDDGSGGISRPDGSLDAQALRTDDRAVTVSSPLVNEASPYAVFSITGSAGQTLGLALAGQTATGGGTDFGPGLEVSFDNGRSWTPYGSAVTLPPGGLLLVRTPVINDTVSDSGETFTLTATPVGGRPAAGTATLRDDGTGAVFRPDGSVDAAAVADDERPLTVDSPTVSEASPYLVFSVGAVAGQRVGLALESGTATVGQDSGTALEVLVGGSWQAYATGSLVTVGGSGTLLVRVAVVNDSQFEGSESLRLVARNAAGVAFAGTGTLRDDGSTATVFDAGNASGVPTTGQADDDRPVPAEPPAPVQPAPAVEPPPVVVAVPEAPAPAVSTVFVSAAPAVVAAAAPAPAPVADILTEASGFRVVVVEAPQPQLSVYRGITDQYVERGQPSSFSLPADAFAHTRAEASISLSVKGADGTALPAWVQFDARSGTFRLDPPAGFEGEVQVMVIARDAEGREARSLFKMTVGKGRLQSMGRPGLSEQLRATAGRVPAWLPAERGAAPRARA